MSHIALYRKYRPSNFEEVVGQKYILETLENAISKDKVAHAYLFCGPRGTGKTSVAKLFAKAINCTSSDSKPCNACENCVKANEGYHTDILELDAASNNGVDQIRDLIDKSKYLPTLGKYKVYIIDEVHMLSQGAFNALLKILEEPPKHLIFILATTESHKILPTIVSRCQKYNFNRVNKDDITNHLKYILKKENLDYEIEALEAIAELADGGMRDSLSILEQIIAYSNEKILKDTVMKVYGKANSETKYELVKAIVDKNVNKIVKINKQIISDGVNVKTFTNEVITFIKNIIIQKEVLTSNFSKDELDKYQDLIRVDISELIRIADGLLNIETKYRLSDNVNLHFEIGLIKLLKHNSVVNNTTEVEMTRTKVEISKPNINENKIDTIEPIPVKEISKLVIETKKVGSKIEKVSAINKSIPTLKEPVYYSDEQIIGLLGIANKTSKAEDLDKYEKLKQLINDTTTRRYVRRLTECLIFASGEKFLILVSNKEEIVNDINDEEDNQGYANFLKEYLNIEKRIIVILNSRTVEIVSKFKEAVKNNTLPKPMDLAKIEVVEETSQNDFDLTKEIEEKLYEVFDDKIIEIK